MQYHGVGRHHDQWPHAPTCGCEWDITANETLMKFYFMFVFSVVLSVINLFLYKCHRTLAVQDCLDSEGIQRLVWPARSPDLNPIEKCGMLWGGKLLVQNYRPTNKKKILIRALTEEWDKLPQQLLDNVVQSMVSVECCITLHGGHISY
ncbi:hypothetical protein TNCV_4114271 [Trichonephila clavipes]|nr:hypothetical protein TNCV_4114271 [Trichonephila clavipes]